MAESHPVFVDGLGRRVVRSGGSEAPFTEHLLLDARLASHAGFAAALAERVAQLHGKRLTSYARVQRLDVDGLGGSTVVSDYVPSWRLADVLDVAGSENLTFDIGVVLLLLRQLLPTAALLSSQARDASSGALGPEHLLLTPQGRLVLADYVFGPAIEALQWTPEELWHTLRVAVPAGGGKAVSQRGDVVQVGVTVISLVIGRRLRDDEYPDRLEDLVQSARQKTPAVVDAPLSAGFRDWLLRALQIGPKGFATLFEAQMSLERVLATDAALLAQPAELDQAVSRLERFMPSFDLPEPELLLEPPPPDQVPVAVAFDEAPAREVAPAPSAEPARTARAAAAEPAPDHGGGSTPTRKSGVRRKAAATPARSEESESAQTVDRPTAIPAVARVHPQDARAAVNSVAPAVGDELDDVEPAGPPTATTPPLADAPRVASWTPVQPPAQDAVPPASTPRAVASEVEAFSDPAFLPPPLAPWWQSARVVAALAGVATLQLVVIGWLLTRPSEALGNDGELVVTSRPEGATVVIDDREHGVTPLTVRVSPGTHVLQVRAGTAEPRVIPLAIRPGVQTAQYVELGVSTTGVLEVRSEPADAKVTIDGQARGSTPLTLRDVAPGDYEVVLERGGRKSTQVVRVDAGTTAQLVVPIR
jgi:PEGA domain